MGRARHLWLVVTIYTLKVLAISNNDFAIQHDANKDKKIQTSNNTKILSKNFCSTYKNSSSKKIVTIYSNNILMIHLTGHDNGRQKKMLPISKYRKVPVFCTVLNAAEHIIEIKSYNSVCGHKAINDRIKKLSW